MQLFALRYLSSYLYLGCYVRCSWFCMVYSKFLLVFIWLVLFGSKRIGGQHSFAAYILLMCLCAVATVADYSLRPFRGFWWALFLNYVECSISPCSLPISLFLPNFLHLVSYWSASQESFQSPRNCGLFFSFKWHPGLFWALMHAILLHTH